MKRWYLALGLGVLAVSLLAAACGDSEDEVSPTGEPATPGATADTTATAVASPRGTPRPGQPSLTGEEVEHLVNDLVREVTFGDETVEETIPDLIVRTAADPDAGRGYRTVALFRNGIWEATIYMRISQPDAEPDPFLDVRADFYYDEEKGEITGANGRGEFALTGKNPCSEEEIESGECDLDEAAFP